MARQAVWSRLKARFNKSVKQRARQPVLGHRGIAIGNIQQPDLSQENINAWQLLSADETTQFLYENVWVNVRSTNVAAMRYEIDKKALHVRYLNGETYGYYDVSEQEAIWAITAPSKGTFVWDALRIRGTKSGHQKPWQHEA